MKFGFVVPQPSPPFQDIFSTAVRCEKAGFDSFWMADHTMIPPPDRCFVPDAYMTLGGVALRTEKMMLATAVTCPHRRSLVVLAQITATLDHMSGGRAALGIGAGESMNLDPFALPWDRPVSRTVEAIEVMKKFWTEDYCFDFEGEFYDVKNGFLQLAPVQKPYPPVYYAANGPRTRMLTGKLYDGWYPVYESPEIYAAHVKDIEAGAKEAGRSIEEIDCGLQLLTSVAGDHDEAVKFASARKNSLANLPTKLKEGGYDIPELTDYSSTFYFDELMVDRESQEKYLKAAEYIPDDALMDFTLTGTVDECIDKIERYQKVGLDHLVIFNLNPDLDAVLGYFEKEIIPYFK